MAKVVYMLGAGASAKSLPTVREIPLFFELFTIWLEWYLSEHPDYNPDSLTDFSQYVDLKIEEAQKYPSTDTYARILKLKDDVGNYQNFNNFLSLFFLWKEVILDYKFSNFSIDASLDFQEMKWSDGRMHPEAKKRELKRLEKIKKDFNENNVYDRFKYNIDPRYFGFFSTILGNSPNNEVTEDIGIISWNYDTQIERTLLELNTKIPKNYIKLNGNVGFKGIPEEAFYKSLSSPEKLISLMTNFNTLESNIQYAWDHEVEENNTFFENLFKDTKKLIVIGYSFPIYNRITDLNIFRILRRETGISRLDFPKVQIVGRSLDTYEQQKNSLVQIMENSAGRSYEDHIEFNNSPDRFPIPPEINILGRN